MSINAPARFELFVLGEGERKIEVEEDTKIPNAATFTLNKEDHTIANMLRSQLLLNSAVRFAGYKVPHPLEPRSIIKVQTDGSITPYEALRQATWELMTSLAHIRQNFEAQSKMVIPAADEAQAGMEGIEGAGGELF